MVPKISVIVAVYKAEAYLPRCVNSLLAQTFKDFEILLIDDGSPDRSGEICDRYARQDSRIRVFHKENGGVSSARQWGTDHARGEYTIHADPDDWVEPAMLEDLYRKAVDTNADMVICDYFTEDKDGSRYVKQQPGSLQSSQVMKDLFRSVLHGSLCNKLIRVNCYRDCRISFPVNLNYSEDWIVCCQLLQDGVKNISYLPNAYYHYDVNINPASLTGSYTKESYYQRRLFLNVVQDKLDLQQFSKEYNVLMTYIVYEAFYNNIFSSSEFRKEFWDKKNRILYSEVNFVIKFFTFLSAIGLNFFAYRLYVFLKLILRKNFCLCMLSVFL